MAAVMYLPMVLLSPASFNLYFCFGSLNLQVALAFWYGPMVYLRTKLFKPESRVVSLVYVSSLLICLYMCITGAGYIMSLLMIGLQAAALGFFVIGALSGGESANGLA